jgi:hypothetical protein
MLNINRSRKHIFINATRYYTTGYSPEIGKESGVTKPNVISPTVPDVVGLIQSDSKRIINLTANVVLNSEFAIVPNVLIIQIERKEPK